MQRRMVDGDEYDAYCARRWYHWQRGELRKIKRRTSKRERKESKEQIRDDRT